MPMNQLRLTAIALLVACCLPAFAAAPVVGQPAPPLTFTDLLQAPAGVKADWPSLRGKVVVLEFWATWCVGCIEEIPQLNALVRSLDPNKVQFIAVDDEDPALVKKFLAKSPISGWVALDTTKKVIDAYDAQVRPRTVVIDPQGQIAAIMNPNQLTREQLLALADGKPVAFPADEAAKVRQQALKEAKAAADAATGAAALAKPLFDISVRPGDPAGRMAFAHRPGKNDDSYTYDALNAPLPVLMQYAGGVAGSRLTVQADKGAKYSLHVAAPSGDIDQLAPAIQLALVTAAGMKLSHVSTLEDAWVLQATPQATSLLPPSTLKQSMCFYKAGKLVMMQTSLNDLASQLEDLLGQPVVNETGISGNFDGNFDLPKNDPEGARLAIEKNLGLTLVKAKRNIDRTVIEPLPSATAPKP